MALVSLGYKAIHKSRANETNERVRLSMKAMPGRSDVNSIRKTPAFGGEVRPTFDCASRFDSGSKVISREQCSRVNLDIVYNRYRHCRYVAMITG
jgi:hypothetical protein